jgi:hypothetical protein
MMSHAMPRTRKPPTDAVKLGKAYARPSDEETGSTMGPVSESPTQWADRHVLVTSGNRIADAFDSATWTTAKVIRWVAKHHAEPGENGQGFDGEDVAVWFRGRLLAVITTGPLGTPDVVRFDRPRPRVRRAPKVETVGPSSPVPTLFDSLTDPADAGNDHR